MSSKKKSDPPQNLRPGHTISCPPTLPLPEPYDPANPFGRQSMGTIQSLEMAQREYEGTSSPIDLENAIKGYELDSNKNSSNGGANPMKVQRKTKSAYAGDAHHGREEINSTNKLLKTSFWIKDRNLGGDSRQIEEEVIAFPLSLPQDKKPGLGESAKTCYWAWFNCGTLTLYYIALLALLIKLLVIQLKDEPYSLEATSGALDYIAVNLESDPIMNIFPVNGTIDQCPSGSEAIHLATWPGIKDGCYYVEEGRLVPTLCSYIAINPDRPIYSLTTQDLYKWKGQVLCINRATKDIDYALTRECETGFKRCFTGLCVKDSLSCPITKVTLTDQPDSTDNIPYGTQFMNFWREEGQPPLINIMASANGLPCFSSKEEPAIGNFYALTDEKANGCASFGVDENSFVIDENNQASFFMYNNVTSPFLKVADYQIQTQNTMVTLAGRTRLQTREEPLCLNVNLERIRDVSKASDDLNDRVLATTGTAIVFHILIGFLLMNFFCGRWWVSSSLQNAFWQGKMSYKLFFIALIFLETITLCVLTVYVILYRSKLKKPEQYFENYVALECFGESQASSVLVSYSDFIHNTASYRLIYAVISFAVTLLYLGIVIVVSRVFVKKGRS